MQGVMHPRQPARPITPSSIIVPGKNLEDPFTAQFFADEPFDEEVFRVQASKFNENQYLHSGTGCLTSDPTRGKTLIRWLELAEFLHRGDCSVKNLRGISPVHRKYMG